MTDLPLDAEEFRTKERWKVDPYLIFHADMLYEMGRLSSGEDLSPVQSALLTSTLLRRRREEIEAKRAESEADLMNLMFVMKPDMFQAYREFKEGPESDAAAVDAESIESRVPQTEEEAREIAAEFQRLAQEMEGQSYEPPDEWREVGPEVDLDLSFLDDDDLGAMGG